MGVNAPALSEKAGKATTVAEGAFNQAKPSLTNSLTSLSSRDPGTLAEYALGAAVIFYLVHLTSYLLQGIWLLQHKHCILQRICFRLIDRQILSNARLVLLLLWVQVNATDSTLCASLLTSICFSKLALPSRFCKLQHDCKAEP